MKKTLLKLFIFLVAIAILTPLGLLAEGDAWGEWSADTLQKLVGFVPEGIKKFSSLWNAPFSDYSIKGLNDTAGYILSAFLGIILLVGVFYLLDLVFFKKKAQ